MPGGIWAEVEVDGGSGEAAQERDLPHRGRQRAMEKVPVGSQTFRVLWNGNSGLGWLTCGTLGGEQVLLT